ncbi:MAG TPA: ATPase, T2SS/T4P/T4SS family, partial [Terriglobales bacterium]|nr:ATPase, T2SS/T4P/T4SS family [Terriglobales bacterium]
MRDYLVYRGVVGHAALDAAIETVAVQEIDLESVLLDHYQASRHDLSAALGRYYQCPFVVFDERTALESGLLKNLSVDYLKKNAWIPLRRCGNDVDILTNDPRDLENGLDMQRAFPGATITLSVGLRRDIDRFLITAMNQPHESSLADILGELASEAGSERVNLVDYFEINENDSVIVRLVNQVIAEAYRQGASDIHIEPFGDREETAVRFRVDGTCFMSMRIPAGYCRAVVSRIKIMANLDIAESRKPQDGKIAHRPAKDREVELRVATLPTAGGNEDVVLRLLTAKEPMRLENMAFSPRILRAIELIAQKPYGIFLCVGPTGSGKTTTLHAVLRSINTDERKIWTAEDPIEITQVGLRQVQVHPK